MLHNFTLSRRFYRSIKVGFNVDYMVRCATSKLIHNGLVFGSIFLLEKFLIEYSSRFFIGLELQSTNQPNWGALGVGARHITHSLIIVSNILLSHYIFL